MIALSLLFKNCENHLRTILDSIPTIPTAEKISVEKLVNVNL